MKEKEKDTLGYHNEATQAQQARNREK